MGRPPKYTPEEIEEMKAQMLDYLNNTDMPIISEFAYTHDVTRPYLYAHPEFMTLLKKMVDKKITYLEKKGLNNEINVAMAIFSLKQLGFSDKQVNVNVETKQEDLATVMEKLYGGSDE